MDDDEIDIERVIGDLQVEISAVTSIVELLLAQHALSASPDDPLSVLGSLRETLEQAALAASLRSANREELDYSERVSEERSRLIEQAAGFVRAVAPRKAR